jgi:hypothetical protein
VISPKEARLLALERKTARLGQILRGLRTDALGVGQGLQDAWSDVAAAGPAPGPPATTPPINACCSAIPTTTTIPFTDSVWGAGNLVWDGSANWAAWLGGLAWPGAGACGACTIAVHYSFDSGSHALSVAWLIFNASQCPAPSTPGFISPPGGQVYEVIAYPAGFHCETTPITALFTMANTAAETLLRTGHASETITLSFPGTTATNGTSDFASVCPCLQTTVTAVDSVYGNTTLTYNPATQKWVGCRTVAYPGTVNCAAGSIAIQYTIVGNPSSNSWQMVVNWASSTATGHACPVLGSTCASTLNLSYPVNATIVCPGGGPTVWTFGPSTVSPWPGTGGATVGVTF